MHLKPTWKVPVQSEATCILSPSLSHRLPRLTRRRLYQITIAVMSGSSSHPTRPPYAPLPCNTRSSPLAPEWIPIITCPADFPQHIVCPPPKQKKTQTYVLTPVPVRNGHLPTYSPPRIQLHPHPSLRHDFRRDRRCSDRDRRTPAAGVHPHAPHPPPTPPTTTG